MEAGQKLRLKKWLGQRLKVPGNELECAAIACIKAGVLLPVDWDGLQVAFEWFISCKTSKQNTTTNKQNKVGAPTKQRWRGEHVPDTGAVNMRTCTNLTLAI